MECAKDLGNQVVKSEMEVHSHVTGGCDNFREGVRNGGGKLFCCLRNIWGFLHIVVMRRYGWIWEMFKEKSQHYLMLGGVWWLWVWRSIVKAGRFFHWEKYGSRWTGLCEGSAERRAVIGLLWTNDFRCLLASESYSVAFWESQMWTECGER